MNNRNNAGGNAHTTGKQRARDVQHQKLGRAPGGALPRGKKLLSSGSSKHQLLRSDSHRDQNWVILELQTVEGTMPTQTTWARPSG